MIRAHLLRILGRTALLLGLATVIPTGTSAQETCKEQLLATLNGVKASVDEAPGQALHSRMEITTTYSDPSQGLSKDTIEQYSGNQRSMVMDKYMTQYEDARNRVVVSNAGHTLYVYDQVPGNTKLGLERWYQGTEKLLELCEISSCRHTKSAEGERMTIELTAADPTAVGNMAQVSYVIDPENKRMLSLKVTYAAHSLLRTYAMKYLTFEPGVLHPGLSRSAIKQVFDGSELLGAFANYTLHDERKKSSGHETPN